MGLPSTRASASSSARRAAGRASTAADPGGCGALRERLSDRLDTAAVGLRMCDTHAVTLSATALSQVTEQ